MNTVLTKTMKFNLDKDLTLKINIHIGYSTKTSLNYFKKKGLVTRDAFDKFSFSIHSCVVSTVKKYSRDTLLDQLFFVTVIFNYVVMQSADLNVVMRNLIFYCSI